AKDPDGLFGGDTNVYAYVENDPVNRRDPSGLIALGLNVSAYSGVGGGARLRVTSQGMSVCLEVGFGAGIEVEANTDGLDREGTAVVVEGPARRGPAGVGAEVTLNDCGEIIVEGKVCVGPVCGKGERTLGEAGGEVGVEGALPLPKNLKEL